MELAQQIEKFRELFDVHEEYRSQLHEQVRKGEMWLNLEFLDLARHSPDLAELLLEQPEEILKAFQMAIEKMDLPRSADAPTEQLEVRIFHLPEAQQLAIRNLRAQHLNKFVEITGVVKQKSDVRPQMTAARFECPSCGNVLHVLQTDQKFQEPSRCGCGRKGKFKLLSKELCDAQSITLEEAPDELDGGEQPKRLKLFLKNDLVSPFTDRRTNPGTKITVAGTIKEVPIILQSGGQATRFDLMLEANSVESVQESFGDVHIEPEEEAKILELSQDPDIFEKFVASIAPSTYGHEPIKQALLLQMFGGVHKSKDKGTKLRGDIHILLIGDPGSGKCVTGDTLVQLGDGRILTMQEAHDHYCGEPQTATAFRPRETITAPVIDETGRGAVAHIKTLWKRHTKEPLLRITLRSGEQITATRDHPFFTTNNGLITATPASELRPGMPIATPRHIQIDGFTQPLLTPKRSRANNAVHITCPTELDEHIARFFGYLAGDGWVSKNRSMISITNNDQCVLDDCAKILQHLKVHHTIRHPHRGKHASEIYACSSELRDFIHKNAPELVRNAGEKCVPACIQRSGQHIIAAFLRALFECDAHNCATSRSIQYASKSPRLAREVRLLLLRFGIHSSIHKKLKHATNGQATKQEYFEVHISGENADRYLDNIGFVSGRKQSVRQRSRYNTNYDTLPGLSKVLHILRTHARKRVKDMAIPAGSSRHYERGDRKPSREQLRKILSIYDADDPLVRILYAFAAADIFWDSIVHVDTVEHQGIDVYDFEIEHVHNFIANGIVIHNSQLLKRVSSIAPKARFVAGRGASGAGLTATVVKDEFLRGWTLEAGALVLANKGLVCIDELDKMSKEDSSAMHEALEQQSVSIAKANIQATLRCETTVLAAANPKFGRFDPYEIISKQIDLPPPLLSRFDLIFPVRDLPDKTKDEKLARFILARHKTEGDHEGLIDAQMIKKYIAYSRQRISPKLTDSAINEMVEYYTRMRGGDEKGEAKNVPITARQLEALIRLSEASARMRLSEKVTKRDAQVAIELTHYCLQQIGMDPDTGKIDMDRITTGISASQRSHISLVKEIIQELEQTAGKVIPIEDIIREAGIKGVAEDTASDVIERLKRSGDIYSPKHGFVSRL
jgi:replicative DNA helicase Mcm